MTPTEALAKLEADYEAATPGPWQMQVNDATIRAADEPEPSWDPWPGDDAPDEAKAAYSNAEQRWDDWWEASSPVAPNDLERAEDAAHIVSAHNALPALLAVAKAAQEVSYLRGEGDNDTDEAYWFACNRLDATVTALGEAVGDAE